MNVKARIYLIAAFVAASLAILAFVAVAGQASSPASGDNVPLAAAAKTSFPGLPAAEGEPDLAGLQTARPTPGQILQVQGPFDDRLVVENLGFDGQAATGAVRITSDVSELLELQVLAGFYDDQGTFLGTARFEFGSEGHDHSGPAEEREEFSIPVPAELDSKAVSAAVGIPVLVNE